MIKTYKHIIWDWNGTLLNDVDICVEIINGMLTKRELKSLTSYEYRDIFTFPVKDYYLKAGLNFDFHPFEALGIEWMDSYESRKQELCLFEDTEKILSAIKESSISQSILSAYPHKTLVEIIKSLKLDHYFTYMAGLGDIYAASKVETGKELIKKSGCQRMM